MRRATVNSAHPATRQLASSSTGAAYAEFLIAFLPIFFLVLGLLQLSMLARADLVVRHAANCAVRSAVVVLDDDPRFYNDAQRLRLDPANGGGGMGSILGMLRPGGGGGGGGGGSSSSSSGRLASIRRAAYRPLLAIAPGMGQVLPRGESQAVIHALGGPDSSAMGDLSRATFGAVYVMAASSVTFPDAPGSTTMRSEWRANERVTVRVTMAYPCLIPVASRLLCDNWIELRTGAPATTLAQGVAGLSGVRDAVSAAGRVRAQRERLTASAQRVREIQDHAEHPNALLGTVPGGIRFAMLSAEATLPLHTAEYPYQSEVSR